MFPSLYKMDYYNPIQTSRYAVILYRPERLYPGNTWFENHRKSNFTPSEQTYIFLPKPSCFRKNTLHCSQFIPTYAANLQSGHSWQVWTANEVRFCTKTLAQGETKQRMSKSWCLDWSHGCCQTESGIHNGCRCSLYRNKGCFPSWVATAEGGRACAPCQQK